MFIGRIFTANQDEFLPRLLFLPPTPLSLLLAHSSSRECLMHTKLDLSCRFSNDLCSRRVRLLYSLIMWANESMYTFTSIYLLFIPDMRPGDCEAQIFGSAAEFGQLSVFGWAIAVTIGFWR